LRVPLSWLRDFAPFEGDAAAIAATLDDLGLVVEGVEHVGEGLGDVVVARVEEIRPIDGADKIRLVVVSDGTTGDIYTVRTGRDTLETLVPRGTFRSPQTPAVLPDGRVMVADYALGLAVIDRQDGTVTWVQHPDTTAVNGIDGMYIQGHTLYAVQNGTSPERVVRFTLDNRYANVTGWNVIERGSPSLGDPTHGVLTADGFYFLGNSGWDRFDDNGSIKAVAASPPAIFRAPLTP